MIERRWPSGDIRILTTIADLPPLRSCISALPFFRIGVTSSMLRASARLVIRSRHGGTSATTLDHANNCFICLSAGHLATQSVWNVCRSRGECRTGQSWCPPRLASVGWEMVGTLRSAKNAPVNPKRLAPEETLILPSSHAGRG